MTREEIIRALKRNIDKPVRIVYSTGDVRSVVPIGVDALGFVYDVEEGGNVEAFFTPFDDIESVLTEGGLTETQRKRILEESI